MVTSWQGPLKPWVYRSKGAREPSSCDLWEAQNRQVATACPWELKASYSSSEEIPSRVGVVAYGISWPRCALYQLESDEPPRRPQQLNLLE